jgi:hypothetical protein
VISEEFIGQLEDELQAASQRRVRLAAARVTRPTVGALGVAFAVLVCVAVVLVALVGPRHATPQIGESAAQRGLAGLEAKLAVLRRAQRPSDRGLVGYSPAGGPLLVVRTRLAATVSTRSAGRVRVYVVVRRLSAVRPLGRRLRRGSVFASVFALARGQIVNATGLIAPATVGTPGIVASGLRVRPGVIDLNGGVSMGLVPDGVARVKWMFTGAGFGVLHPRPVTVYPKVVNNVAVAPVVRGEGPLGRGVWYGAHGQVIAFAAGAAQASQQLQRIRSVNASRDRSIAPLLLAHYSLFHSTAADDPARDLELPTPGTAGGYVGEMDLNYWQTRYIPTLTGMDGRGLWITPGTRGWCISDPQANACGMLKSQDASGIIGVATSNGNKQTISGLVPDGNQTVTLVLANGTRMTVPVVDHNVYEATVPGRIIAIINRDADGRIQRHSL